MPFQRPEAAHPPQLPDPFLCLPPAMVGGVPLTGCHPGLTSVLPSPSPSLTLHPPSPRDPCDCTGPTLIIRDNLPTLQLADSLCSLNSLTQSLTWSQLWGLGCGHPCGCLGTPVVLASAHGPLFPVFCTADCCPADRVASLRLSRTH